MFDVSIFVSSEDDKYLVAGGIGTYLGLLTRFAREVYPKMEVVWISKSPNNESFEEVDMYGVKRFYVAAGGNYDNCPFSSKINIGQNQSIADTMSFRSNLLEKVNEVLVASEGKTILLESGEWEGHASELFKICTGNNLLKVARLHTPLATCLRQNKLKLSALNVFQLINEYEVMKNADVLSACTNHVKERVIEDVLEKDSPLGKRIVTLPNPINTSAFGPDVCTRDEGISEINEILNDNFLSAETYNVLIIGSVERRKGADLVCKSVPLIADKIPNIRFCFIGHHGGNGDSITANKKIPASELLKIIPEKYHKFVAFTDYVEYRRLPRLVMAGDVFPIMSRGDNFPGTVAEISLSAKPIIALERGGVREMLLSEDGDFLAISLGGESEGSEVLLARELEALYGSSDRQVRLGLDLRNLMLKKYEPRVVVENMYNIYSRIFCDKVKVIS